MDSIYKKKGDVNDWIHDVGFNNTVKKLCDTYNIRFEQYRKYHYWAYAYAFSAANAASSSIFFY